MPEATNIFAGAKSLGVKRTLLVACSCSGGVHSGAYVRRHCGAVRPAKPPCSAATVASDACFAFPEGSVSAIPDFTDTTSARRCGAARSFRVAHNQTRARNYVAELK